MRRDRATLIRRAPGVAAGLMLAATGFLPYGLVYVRAERVHPVVHHDVLANVGAGDFPSVMFVVIGVLVAVRFARGAATRAGGRWIAACAILLASVVISDDTGAEHLDAGGHLALAGALALLHAQVTCRRDARVPWPPVARARGGQARRIAAIVAAAAATVNAAIVVAPAAAVAADFDAAIVGRIVRSSLGVYCAVRVAREGNG
jgi:hypothetical protein